MRASSALLVLSVAALAGAATGEASGVPPARQVPSSSLLLSPDVDAGARSGPVAPLPPTSGPATETPSATPTATPASTASGSPSPEAIPADLRVQVPRLGIDLPLVTGDVTRDTPGPAYPGGTPERVALIYPTSALPGSGGNTYVYAHARRGMFLSLWGAQLGDTVRIRSDSTAFVLTYTVTRIVPRVPPTDTSWLDQGGPERVTLQTSTGPLPADPRFVVIAVRDR